MCGLETVVVDCHMDVSPACTVKPVHEGKNRLENPGSFQAQNVSFPYRLGPVNGCVLDRPPSTGNACPFT
jgi:hypothetical protein